MRGRSGDAPVLGYYHRQAVERIRSIVDGLALDVNREATRLSPEFKTAFSAWIINVWGPFYREKSRLGWIEALSPPMLMLLTQELVRMNGEALAWRATFERMGGRSTVPLPITPLFPEGWEVPGLPGTPGRGSPPGKPMGGLERVMWGAIVVGGIVAVGYVIKAFKS